MMSFQWDMGHRFGRPLRHFPISDNVCVSRHIGGLVHRRVPPSTSG